MATSDDPMVSNHEDDRLNEESADPNTQPNKRQKHSFVGEHLTIKVCPDTPASKCSGCGSRSSSTLEPPKRREWNSMFDAIRVSKSGGSGSNSSSSSNSEQEWNSTFDVDRARHEIANMIIMHDYPLHVVEHVLQTFQPQFKMVSFNTVHGDCLITYQEEKDKLLRSVKNIPGRVCLALDMWASSQGVGYVFVTGHFIDADWKLQRRLLNVVMEPYPNSDTALSHAVGVCLHEWGLKDNLFSLTTNKSLGEAAIEALRSQMAIKNPHILEGQLLVGNCIARTFCAIALDILEEGKEIIGKVRDIVKYVKTSDLHEEKFTQLKQELHVPSKRSLSIDDTTQWNTTYQMLVAASELKEVFSFLDMFDLDDNGAPSSNEWKQIETICSYLKLVFDAANILTAIAAATKPSPITFFHEVCTIQVELSRAAAADGDPFSSSLAKRMLEKVEDYWKNCSLALATAVVMDPQFKMQLVEFSFNETNGEEAPVFIKVVKDGIRELFHEYEALSLLLTPTSGNLKSDENHGGTHLVDKLLMDFDKYIKESTSQHMKSELDQYLEESLLALNQDFDVLGWWKLNRTRYPILSKMAIDILSIQVSTVSSDSVFRTTVKEMDSNRSSLRPDVVEALICAKDWMK